MSPHLEMLLWQRGCNNAVARRVCTATLCCAHARPGHTRVFVTQCPQTTTTRHDHEWIASASHRTKLVYCLRPARHAGMHWLWSCASLALNGQLPRLQCPLSGNIACMHKIMLLLLRVYCGAWGVGSRLSPSPTAIFAAQLPEHLCLIAPMQAHDQYQNWS